MSTTTTLQLHPAKEGGAYGPGSWVDTSFTSVPEECKRVLALLATQIPGFPQDPKFIENVTFRGDDLPCIPGPIKSQVVTAALHAASGIIGHEILELRGIATDYKTGIDSVMGALWPAMPALVAIDGVSGPEILDLPTIPHLRPPPSAHSVDVDFDHVFFGNSLKLRSTAIYPTATEGVWMQVHGSMNPYPTLEALGLSRDFVDADNDKRFSNEQAYDLIKSITLKHSAKELELIFIERNVPSSIIYSIQGWQETIMGKVLSEHPLINYRRCKQASSTPPVPFPKTLDQRPLAGIKVIEFARVIALPATGVVLTSLGAEVIRVQSKNLPDFTVGFPSPDTILGMIADHHSKTAQLFLTQGKKTIHLDLNDETDKATLRALFEDADVILQGYRAGSFDRRGFGLDDALEVANKRGKGIVYLQENCYGPDGVYHERRGWQQIADAASGASYVMGKALGYPDGQGILPSLPISDMTTGIVGAVTVLSMIRDRARFGGSYQGASALTAYNSYTLTKDIGLYQPEIVQKIQDKYKFKQITSSISVVELYYEILEAWKKSSRLAEDEQYYTHFNDSVYGSDIRILKPLVEYTNEMTTPRWTKPPVPFCHYKSASWEGKQ